jgi:hypothetical protein
MKKIISRLAIAAAFASIATIASASDADFKLVNKTGYEIDSVYVAPSSSDNWGNDIMGDNSVPDGTTVNITFPHGGKACKFDIRVKYHDGDKAEWSNVDLCEYEKISLFWDGKQTRAVGE